MVYDDKSFDFTISSAIMKLIKSKHTKFKQIMLKSLSAFFVFWLSSVLVLACCGSQLFMASAMNAESCPMGKGHECCKKKTGAKNVLETEKDKADCCAFKPAKTLSADLQNTKNIKQAQAVIQKFEAPKPVYFIKQTYKSPNIYHSAICNRGSTYLQNCVFRI